jgi:hypothetical protein
MVKHVTQNCYRRWDLGLHYTPESEAESMTCKHPHYSVKKVHDSAVSRSKDGHNFWGVYGVMMVDFIPTDSTINAAAHQETLKKLKDAIRKKIPGFLTT